MKEKKVSNNIIYSVLTQLAGFIAPLIISPYISRVFNAELIGDYSYTLANSTYFVIIEGLGLTLYGTLLIARERDDLHKRSVVFWEIFWIKIVLMIACLTLYYSLFIVGGNQRLHTLYLIMMLNIIANGIDITWFLNGLEEFKIVAIRTIFVRVINIILVLCLVKSIDDLYLYAFIMQGAAFLSFLSVLPIGIKKVKWISVKELQFKRYIKPSMVYFVPGIVNAIFTAADKSVLGSFTNNPGEVGVYEQANKICQLCAGLISAVSNAVLPRITYLYANSDDRDTVNLYVKRTIRIAMLFSLPMTAGIAMISDTFVPWFFGPGYEKSAVLLKILCVNVFFTSVGNFISQQCLISRGKQKEYNIAIVISATINLLLNILLVRSYLSVGVAFSSAITGIAVFVMVLAASKDTINIKDIASGAWRYILGVALMGIAISALPAGLQGFKGVLIQVVVGAITYFISIVLLRDQEVLSIIKKGV